MSRPACQPARAERALPRMVQAACALLCIGLLALAGCASRAQTPAATDPGALLGQPPSGAFLREGELVIEYASGPQRYHLTATWPGDDATPAVHRYRTAVIAPAAETALPADPAARTDWQRVRLLESAAWNALMNGLLEGLAAGPPDAGTLVTVQGADFVLQRDAGGALRVHSLESKPAALKVVRRISEDAFAARANAHVQASLAPAGEAAAPVLFDIGADELGGAFLLFDFARNQSVFIAQPASPLPAAQHVGFTLRLIDALTLRSHVLTALRHPVTLANRLFWLTTHTGATLLPRGVAASEAPPPPLVPREGMDLQQWERELDALVGAERSRGSLQPLIDGEAFFLALVQAIQDARESIDIRLYIFDSDAYALRIADLLKERSREVRVRVLVDRFGSMAAGQVPSKSPYYASHKPPLSIAAYLRQDSKVEVMQLDNPWLTSDHTKVIVVDGRRAFLGGMNIGREYRYEWHDLMVETTGPIVGRLQKDFDKRWAHAGPGGDLAFALAALKPQAAAADTEAAEHLDIRPLYTRSGDAQILRAQLAAIRRARAYIYVQQPYLSDDEVISELIAARRRGVDVRVILPTSNDSGFMNSANLLAARAFLRHGVRVYGYPGMTHVKAAIYDGWACVGSANFDKLSLRINQETNLATADPRFVDALRRDLFEADFARSKEWTEAKPVRWNDYIAEFIADQL